MRKPPSRGASLYLLLICVAFVAAPAAPQTREQKAQALIDAYPGHIASFDGTFLIWKDGTKMPFGEGAAEKSPESLLEEPELVDMFRWPYPFGREGVPASRGHDPGRVRFEPFFEKMYGPCAKEPAGGCERVRCSGAQIERVPWMPKLGGGSMRATTVNGVAEKLRLVIRELEALGPEMAPFLVPSGGSHVPRCIAGTTRLSVHSYGIAFDINPRHGQYWRFGLPGPLSEREVRERGIALVYRNSVPLEIVEAFEKHGLIWGGKWHHFDGMHFEYRPEFLALKRIMEK